jgi:hypothetical protein
MSNILFIADFFADEVNGGGELNNKVLIDALSSMGHTVRRANSHKLKRLDMADNNSIIVSNFVNLSEENKRELQNKNYIIYEHDHKYLLNRNPHAYPNYQAPKEHIINQEFYANAKAVLCQSNFHAEIVKKNLQLDNIVSLSGNLWSNEHLDLLEEMSKVEKINKCVIMDSPIPHKNTVEAILYCQALQLEYALVPPLEPSAFLQELGKYETLVFFPKTPETLSRITVEARMMGMKTKTTNNIGAIHEAWFSMKGLDLIKYIRHRQGEIFELVEGQF